MTNENYGLEEESPVNNKVIQENYTNNFLNPILEKYESVFFFFLNLLKINSSDFWRCVRSLPKCP